jgi:hypothetical protein
MKQDKRELNEVHLGPNAEQIEKQAKKIRQWIYANGIFEIKIKPKDDTKK